MHSALARRVVTALLFLVGILVGIAGAFTQAIIVWAGTVPLPVGVVLTLLGCASLYVFGGTLLRSTAGAALPGVGWLLPTALFVVFRPHGSTVISLAADVHGIFALVYVLVGVVIILAAAYTPWRLLTERWDRQTIGRRAEAAAIEPPEPARPKKAEGATAAGSTDPTGKTPTGKAPTGTTAAGKAATGRPGAGKKPAGKQQAGAKSAGGATRAVGGQAKQRPQRGDQARKR